VPEGQTVLSNGRLARVAHDKSAHTVTYDWVESVPHSTYLISIVAGPPPRAGALAPSVSRNAQTARANAPAIVPRDSQRIAVGSVI
jgi:aminopeptidase N